MPPSDARSAFKLRYVFLALGAFAACFLAAALVHVLIGEGRDIRPASGSLTIFILVAITWMVGWRRHRVAESLVALVVVEALVVWAIGWLAYGGVPRLDRFFFTWFIPGSLVTALPWLVGAGLGTWLSRRRSPA